MSVEINKVSGTQGLAEIEKSRHGKKTNYNGKGLRVTKNMDDVIF